MMPARTLSVDDDELARLIQRMEDWRVKFKESLGGSAREGIREAICAFANDLPDSRQPGIVVVGLTDKGAPTGTEVTDEMLRTLTNMRSDGNIVPPPTLLVERRLYRDATIALVTVTPSDSPPVRCRGTVHVRAGPRRSIATAQDERILNEKRRHGDRPFDLSPVAEAKTSDLNRRQFEDEYLARALSREALAANDRSYRERLASCKMIGSLDDDRATILGILVVGVRPRDWIPGACVQFLRIAGQDLSDSIVDEMTIDGTISDTLRRLEEKLQSHNRRRIDFVQVALERQTEIFPIAALQQLVRNAVMHRAYEGTHAPIRVSWFDDRIEIHSPGGPFGAVTEANFGQPGVTDYRNPNLAESMKVLGLVQRFGVGIPTARRLLSEAGHPDLEFKAGPSHMLATIRTVPEPLAAPP